MRRFSILLLPLALAGMALWPAGAGLAVSLPHPEPPRRLTVQGTLAGKLGKGGKVNFNIVATDPQNWTHLKSVKIVMLLRGFSIQEIEYFVSSGTIGTTGLKPVPFGGPPVQGSFLRIINGNTSRRVRQTFSITLTFWARVTESIPGGTRLRLLATDEDGNVSRATNRVAVSKGLLSWGTLGLAAALALFIGGFFGNSLTHRRYRQHAPSIWQVVERRIKEQRVRPPNPVAGSSARDRTGLGVVP
jgi:hypothetical protein